MTENLINRISFYLASGGLFNPELADHIAVRTLLFECREALAQPEQLREENERLHVENRRLIDRIETIGVPVGVGGFATTTSTRPEQEPVAVVDSTISGHIDWLCTVFPKQGTKLYTTPPQRTWVGLTLDDIPDDDTNNLDFYRGGRWAERILKEKNT